MLFSKLVKYGLAAVLFLISSLNISAQDYIPDPNYRPDTRYAEELVSKAFEMRLYDDPYWKKLLHYKVGLLGGRSLVDDKKFFLSENGKYSLQDEMAATIRSYFLPIEKDKIHAGIRFIARYSWLSEKLSIDKAKLPFDFEEKFRKYYDSLNLDKTLVVFPAGFMGSPASMFGHTLIVFENKQKRRIISPAVNYAANTEESFGPWFAVKGLFGLYNGYFSVMPYSDKINEYNNSEMRDMWEYTLNLSDEENRRAFKHIVEMDKVGSRYFFLDENCSYNLLFLIDVARPELDLTSGYFFSAEPVDTVRGLIESGVVERKDYRPSLYSQILSRSSKVSYDESIRMIAYCKGNISMEEFKSSISPDNYSIVYDLSSDYLKFLLVKDKITIEDYQKRLLEVLRERSRVGDSESVLKDDDIPFSPDSAHYSRKLSLAGGVFDDDKYLQMSFRVTCHELIDSNQGLAKGSEIQFGACSFRYFTQEKKFRFQQVTAVKVISLPASDRFNVANCYLLDTGGRQCEMPDKKTSFGGFVNGGSGFSVMMFNFFQFYAMAEADLRFAGGYKYNSLISGGGRVGLMFDICDIWKNVSHLSLLASPLGDKTKIFRLSVDERLKITRNCQVVFSYRNDAVFSKRTHDLSFRAEMMF